MEQQAVLITPRSFPSDLPGTCDILRKAGYEVILNPNGRTLTEDEMISAIRDVVGIIVGIDPLTDKVLANARRLKAISKYGAGIDNIHINAARSRGIEVRRTVGANSNSVAEFTVGLLLCLYRNMWYSASGVKRGDWSRKRGREIAGSTVGLIGCGNIGREVAKKLLALGAHVIVHDNFLQDTEFIEAHGIPLVSFEDLLRESDAVSLHCPLTTETRHVINHRAISSMREGAYLVNTARGELVDEDDLYDALKSGKLSGAAQDVFSSEPPPPDCKLLELENFILTAHIGAYTQEAVYRMATTSTRNLLEMLQDDLDG
jgi:phosphoglycerate dehydrogenase-like enzyme